MKKEKALKIQNLKKSEAKAKSNVDKLKSYTDSTMKVLNHDLFIYFIYFSSKTYLGIYYLQILYAI